MWGIFIHLLARVPIYYYESSLAYGAAPLRAGLLWFGCWAIIVCLCARQSINQLINQSINHASRSIKYRYYLLLYAQILSAIICTNKGGLRSCIDTILHRGNSWPGGGIVDQGEGILTREWKIMFALAINGWLWATCDTWRAKRAENTYIWHYLYNRQQKSVKKWIKCKYTDKRAIFTLFLLLYSVLIFILLPFLPFMP